MRKLFAFFGTFSPGLNGCGSSRGCRRGSRRRGFTGESRDCDRCRDRGCDRCLWRRVGQGRVGAAAMESIGRNPNAAEKLFLPLVLTLALLEALALYGFVIAILLQGKI